MIPLKGRMSSNTTAKSKNGAVVPASHVILDPNGYTNQPPSCSSHINKDAVDTDIRHLGKLRNASGNQVFFCSHKEQGEVLFRKVFGKNIMAVTGLTSKFKISPKLKFWFT